MYVCNILDLIELISRKIQLDFIIIIGKHSTDPVPESLSSSVLGLFIKSLASNSNPASQLWLFRGGRKLISQFGHTNSSLVDPNIPQASSLKVWDATLLLQTWMFWDETWKKKIKKIDHLSVSKKIYLVIIGLSLIFTNYSIYMIFVGFWEIRLEGRSKEPRMNTKRYCTIVI